MRKSIYKAVALRLKEANIGIQHISLWNANTEYLATNAAFRMPAVFVEYEPIEWSQLSRGVRSADLRVRLHIITETLATPEDGGKHQDMALAHLELIESISGAIQGLMGDGFNGFMPVESVTDHNHGRIEHNEECFIARITDTSGKRKQATATGITLLRSE